MRGFAAAAAEPVVGELHAIRAFQLGDDGLLFPLVPGPGPWAAGTNTASCTAEEAHEAPDPGCTCGFYAYFDPRWVYGGGVAAVVSAWGQTIVGSRGVRAQYARIEAVCLPGDVPAEVVARVAAAYPDIVIHRDVRTLIAAHPLTPRRGLRLPHLPQPSAPGVRRTRVGLALAFLIALTVAALTPALHPAAWGVWLRLLAAVLALVPLAVRPAPVPRWREVWLVGRPGWLTLLAVSFLIAGGTGERIVGCVGAAVVLLLLVTVSARRPARATPIKPNVAARDLLRRRGGTGWGIGSDVTHNGIRQIESRRAEGGGTVRYLSHMTFVRMSPGQRVNTGTRVLSAAAEFGPGGATTAIVEAMPSAGWVEVIARAVTTDLDASLRVADVVEALGLPPQSLGRTEFAAHEHPIHDGPDRRTEPGTHPW